MTYLWSIDTSAIDPMTVIMATVKERVRVNMVGEKASMKRRMITENIMKATKMNRMTNR